MFVLEIESAHPCYRTMRPTQLPHYVTSNRYPGHYEANIDCTSEVVFDRQTFVKVTFLDLDIAEPELESQVRIQCNNSHTYINVQ